VIHVSMKGRGLADRLFMQFLVLLAEWGLGSGKDFRQMCLRTVVRIFSDQIIKDF